MGVTGTSGWWLAVDFGTANTAAADVDATVGLVLPSLSSHQVNLMPSAVHVSSATQIDVGVVARNRANDDPDGYVVGPKRYLALGGQSCQIGLLEVPLRNLVAAVLRAALSRAQQRQQGRTPSGVVLTHPEYWAADQIQVLVDAAADVGFPSNTVRTVSEPRAAAHHYSQAVEVRAGDRLAVIDCGSGTLDVTVLTLLSDGTFEVAAARGDSTLGGDSFDALVRRWVIIALAQRNPDLSARLLEGNVPTTDTLAFADSVRQAKELLSETTMANIDVRAGDLREQVVLTRREFDDLISAEVHRALDFARATFESAGIHRPAELSALYLTGGSSRIPLLRHRLEELGQVAALDDAEIAVAHGALLEVHGVDRGLATVPFAPVAPGPNPGQATRLARQADSNSSRSFATAGVAGGVAFAVLLASAIALGVARGHRGAAHAARASVSTSTPAAVRPGPGPVSTELPAAQTDAGDSDAPSAAAVAPDTTDSHSSADPICSGMAGDLVTSDAPGGQDSPAHLVAAVMYARYVTRDPAKFTALYAAAPPATAIQNVIDAAPAGTQYCVAATVTGPGTMRVVLRQEYPGMTASGLQTQTWTVSPSAPFTIDHVAS